MITDRTGGHEVLSLVSLINNSYNNICDFKAFYDIKTQQIPRVFASSGQNHSSARVRWPVLSSYIGTTRTDLLHCPISAEIRIVLSK